MGGVVKKLCYGDAVRLSVVATGTPLQTLDGYSGNVKPLAFPTDGKVVDTLLLLGS